MISNRIFGDLAHRISSYVMCLNIAKRKIFLCRAGQSEDRDDVNNVIREANKLRTNSEQAEFTGIDEMMCQRVPSLETLLPPADMKFWHLNEEGKRFAGRLRSFVEENVPDVSKFIVYTSMLPRALETVQVYIPALLFNKRKSIPRVGHAFRDATMVGPERSGHRHPSTKVHL